MSLQTLLLILHIAGGFLALASAVVAIANKLVNAAHRWHVYSGQVYFWAMVVAVCTAIPLSIMTANLFLLLISIFTGYLIHAGWRYAKNRTGKPRLQDWLSVGFMLVAATVMAVVGIRNLIGGDTQAIVLIAFAILAWGNAGRDLWMLKSGGATGKQRVAMHLTMMLAATIATVTAFVVTNFTLEPAFILWLLPTVVITPIIVVMNRRVLR